MEVPVSFGFSLSLMAVCCCMTRTRSRTMTVAARRTLSDPMGVREGHGVIDGGRRGVVRLCGLRRRHQRFSNGRVGDRDGLEQAHALSRLLKVVFRQPGPFPAGVGRVWTIATKGQTPRSNATGSPALDQCSLHQGFKPSCSTGL